MSSRFIDELRKRQIHVEKIDSDLISVNNSEYRSYWLNMTILSGAILIGVIPLLGNNQSVVKSIILAKMGVVVLIIVCTSIVIYFQGVLSRGKKMLIEQQTHHNETFAKQASLLEKLGKEGKSEQEMESYFEKSKAESYSQEVDIMYENLLGGRFSRVRTFIDGHFNRYISFGFSVGVILITLSLFVSV